MATLIRPDSTTQVVRPANGTDFTLDELYRILNCTTVEAVYLPDGRIMVIDEDGKFSKPLDVNPEATKLGFKAGIATSDYIVGDALVCSNEELK